VRYAADVVRQYRASDGRLFDTRDGKEQHEVGLLCARVGKADAGELLTACSENDTPRSKHIRADILALASVFRAPRKRAGTGESASDPTPATSTEPLPAAPSQDALSNGATSTVDATAEGQSDAAPTAETAIPRADADGSVNGVNSSQTLGRTARHKAALDHGRRPNAEAGT
jgi:hypothetical protein